MSMLSDYYRTNIGKSTVVGAVLLHSVNVKLHDLPWYNTKTMYSAAILCDTLATVRILMAYYK